MGNQRRRTRPLRRENGVNWAPQHFGTSAVGHHAGAVVDFHSVPLTVIRPSGKMTARKCRTIPVKAPDCWGSQANTRANLRNGRTQESLAMGVLMVYKSRKLPVQSP